MFTLILQMRVLRQSSHHCRMRARRSNVKALLFNFDVLYSFYRYLLRVYYVPGTEDAAANKKEQRFLILMELLSYFTFLM